MFALDVLGVYIANIFCFINKKSVIAGKILLII